MLAVDLIWFVGIKGPHPDTRISCLLPQSFTGLQRVWCLSWVCQTNINLQRTYDRTSFLQNQTISLVVAQWKYRQRKDCMYDLILFLNQSHSCLELDTWMFMLTYEIHEHFRCQILVPGKDWKNSSRRKRNNEHVMHLLYTDGSLTRWCWCPQMINSPCQVASPYLMSFSVLLNPTFSENQFNLHQKLKTNMWSDQSSLRGRGIMGNKQSLLPLLLV